MIAEKYCFIIDLLSYPAMLGGKQHSPAIICLKTMLHCSKKLIGHMLVCRTNQSPDLCETKFGPVASSEHFQMTII